MISGNNLRRLPQNIKKKDLNIFENAREYNHKTPYLLEYKDVTITSNGIVYNEFGNWINKIVFSHSFSKKESYYYSSIDKVSIGYKYYDKALWLSDSWSKGYYHLIVELIPKLIHISITGIKEDLCLLLPNRYKNIEALNYYLELLNINYSYIQTIRGVKVKKLFFRLRRYGGVWF